MSPEPFPAEPELANLEKFFAAIVANFPPTLDANGALTPASIRFIMDTLQQRDTQRVQVADRPNNPAHNSIMRTEPITGLRFDQLWEFLETP